MKFRHVSIWLAATALGCLLAPVSALAQSGPPAGRLSCTIGNSVAAVVNAQKPMACRYYPRRGPVQSYTAVVRRYGVDLGGMRGTRMSWRVFGPYARAPLGALTGSYKATTPTPTADGSVGVPVLAGNQSRQVTLRPLAVQSLRGLNIAIGVSELDVTLNPPRRRR